MLKLIVKKLIIIAGIMSAIGAAVLGVAALSKNQSENPLSPEEWQAKLFLQPDKGKFVLDKDFQVSVKLTTNTAINAGEASLYFPVDKLEIEAISFEKSIFSLWVVEPSFSNQEGLVRFSGVSPNPGFQGEEGEILTITFKPKKEGEAKIIFGQALVLANDGKGTNILKELEGASFILITPAAYDLNNDNNIDIYDLSILAANWGIPKNPKADINQDGQVNLTDFSILIFNLVPPLDNK